MKLVRAYVPKEPSDSALKASQQLSEKRTTHDRGPTASTFGSTNVLGRSRSRAMDRFSDDLTRQCGRANVRKVCSDSSGQPDATIRCVMESSPTAQHQIHGNERRRRHSNSVHDGSSNHHQNHGGKTRRQQRSQQQTTKHSAKQPSHSSVESSLSSSVVQSVSPRSCCATEKKELRKNPGLSSSCCGDAEEELSTQSKDLTNCPDASSANRSSDPIRRYTIEELKKLRYFPASDRDSEVLHEFVERHCVAQSRLVTPLSSGMASFVGSQGKRTSDASSRDAADAIDGFSKCTTLESFASIPVKSCPTADNDGSLPVSKDATGLSKSIQRPSTATAEQPEIMDHSCNQTFPSGGNELLTSFRDNVYALHRRSSAELKPALPEVSSMVDNGSPLPCNSGHEYDVADAGQHKEQHQPHVPVSGLDQMIAGARKEVSEQHQAPSNDIPSWSTALTAGPAEQIEVHHSLFTNGFPTTLYPAGSRLGRVTPETPRGESMSTSDGTRLDSNWMSEFHQHAVVPHRNHLETKASASPRHLEEKLSNSLGDSHAPSLVESQGKQHMLSTAVDANLSGVDEVFFIDENDVNEEESVFLKHFFKHQRGGTFLRLRGSLRGDIGPNRTSDAITGPPTFRAPTESRRMLEMGQCQSASPISTLSPLEQRRALESRSFWVTSDRASAAPLGGLSPNLLSLFSSRDEGTDSRSTSTSYEQGQHLTTRHCNGTDFSHFSRRPLALQQPPSFQPRRPHFSNNYVSPQPTIHQQHYLHQNHHHHHHQSVMEQSLFTQETLPATPVVQQQQQLPLSFNGSADQALLVNLLRQQALLTARQGNPQQQQQQQQQHPQEPYVDPQVLTALLQQLQSTAGSASDHRGTLTTNSGGNGGQPRYSAPPPPLAARLSAALYTPGFPESTLIDSQQQQQQRQVLYPPSKGQQTSQTVALQQFHEAQRFMQQLVRRHQGGNVQDMSRVLPHHPQAVLRTPMISQQPSTLTWPGSQEFAELPHGVAQYHPSSSSVLRHQEFVQQPLSAAVLAHLAGLPPTQQQLIAHQLLASQQQRHASSTTTFHDPAADIHQQEPSHDSTVVQQHFLQQHPQYSSQLPSNFNGNAGVFTPGMDSTYKSPRNLQHYSDTTQATEAKLRAAFGTSFPHGLR